MRKLESNEILVIAGPTASGKSRLALDLAASIPLEIISADSMQVYRGMDIGTDKPSREEQERVAHHLIDVKDPDQEWSVEEFVRLAQCAIRSIKARGRVPCIVGGTGFYMRALLRDYPLEDAPPDWEFRRRMQGFAKEHGNEALHNKLLDKDPVSWKNLHPQDQKRVIRALEYYEATGKPISSRVGATKTRAPRYQAAILGLWWERQELYQRIDYRVERQFKRGLVEEVKYLLDQGYSQDLPSMQGLCYKETCNYLAGFSTLDETKNLIMRNTRRLAKRQFTWFSREEGINWVRAGKDRSWDSIVKEAKEAAGY
ncbi:MAG: tRNA (adenosine(37)-N6)-dimethylallyltransferase MiaA [Bacillota bacterium]|jgi:tRNA dimethylallyltransferase